MDNPPLRLLQNWAIALDCNLDDLIEDEWRYTRPGFVPTRPPKLDA